jgi:two-component system LytT family response regulator
MIWWMPMAKQRELKFKLKFPLNMIRAILVDDEVHCLNSLSIQLSEHCSGVEILAKCMSGKSALEAIAKVNPELVFLDIEMPNMNGFEFLEQCKQISFSVIFTTSYDQYAIKAFRISALDYLLKPIDPEELVAAVQKVEVQKSRPLTEQFREMIQQIQHLNKGITKIGIPTIEGFELIPADKIVYCEASNNYTFVYLKDRTKIVACRGLKEMEEQLQDFKSFLRVHNSYLVNLNEVNRYIRGDGGYLVLTDGTSVNVSRGRKDALMKFLDLSA